MFNIFFPKVRFYLIFTIPALKQSESYVLIMKKFNSWEKFFAYCKFSPIFLMRLKFVKSQQCEVDGHQYCDAMPNFKPDSKRFYKAFK